MTQCVSFTARVHYYGFKWDIARKADTICIKDLHVAALAALLVVNILHMYTLHLAFMWN